MNEQQRKQIEERLQKEREKTLKAIRHVEEDEDPEERASGRDEARFSTHLADQGSDAEERERDFMIAAMESDLLTRINEALKLLIDDPERFERCERCDSEIAMERFDLLPWTRLCSRCAAAEENQ